MFWRNEIQEECAGPVTLLALGVGELLLKPSAPNLGSHVHPCISLTSRRSESLDFCSALARNAQTSLGPALLLRCPWIKLQWRRGCTVVASALGLYCSLFPHGGSLFSIGYSLLPCCCCSCCAMFGRRCVIVDRIQPLYLACRLYISLTIPRIVTTPCIIQSCHNYINPALDAIENN